MKFRLFFNTLKKILKSSILEDLYFQKSQYSLSTATHFSLQKVNFESASKVVPNDCNDMFWCISITNNVKSCKKFSEKAQTGKITVFTMVNQHCGAENMEK